MTKTNYFFTLVLSFFLINANNSFALPKIKETNYFASIRATKANVRSGPGTNYPIKFIFKLQGMPVNVISEYDNWNEIKDFEGQTGWISQSLISKKRTLMVQSSRNLVNMHSKNSEKSRIILRLENKVVGSHVKCLKKWCALKVNGKKGWVKKQDLFGDE